MFCRSVLGRSSYIPSILGKELWGVFFSLAGSRAPARHLLRSGGPTPSSSGVLGARGMRAAEQTLRAARRERPQNSSRCSSRPEEPGKERVNHKQLTVVPASSATPSSPGSQKPLWERRLKAPGACRRPWAPGALAPCRGPRPDPRPKKDPAGERFRRLGPVIQRAAAARQVSASAARVRAACRRACPQRPGSSNCKRNTS